MFAVLLGLTVMAQESTEKEKKSFLSFQLGPSIPVGDFVSTDLASNDQAGFALTGITLDLNYLYQITENVGLAASGFYNMNGLDISKLRELTGVPSLKMDHWQFIGLVVGPAFSFEMSPKAMADIRVMGGIATANSPDVKVNGTPLVPEDWGGAGVFQAGIGCRVNLGSKTYFTGGVDYRYLQPTFKVKYDSTADEVKQNMSVVNISVGLGFKF